MIANVLDINPSSWPYYAKKGINNGLIVVNIIFASPKVDLVIFDARYTLIDKITSLGGSFGLFTQFTGCSIIAVIHLTILTMKHMFAFMKELKNKCFN